MQLFIDVLSIVGDKVGGGPITSATDWTSTRRMDRAGSFGFTMVASDPQAAYVTEKRRVICYALLNNVWTQIGDGIIDQIETIPTADGTVMLSVSGQDSVYELAGFSAGYTAIADGSNAMPVQTGLDLLASIATNTYLAPWTFDYTSVAANPEVYALLQGESLLASVSNVARTANYHFRSGGSRALAFFQAFTPSGVRAIRANGNLQPETCAITGLRRTVETHDLFTRIIPFGAGQGRARLTLAPSSRETPIGYTASKVQIPNFIQKDSAAEAYGRIDRWVEFKEIGPIANTDLDVQAAANALFDYAKIHLDLYSQRATHYTLEVAQCSRALLPGQSIRVDYRDVASGLVINEDLYIIEATIRVNVDGVQTTSLVVSDQDRWPLNDAELLGNALAEARIYRSHPQLNANSYTTSYTKNIDDAETATIRFWFGNEVVQLQQVLVQFQLLQFESTVRAVALESMTGGSGQLITDSGGGGDTTTPSNDTSGAAVGDTGAAAGDTGAAAGNTSGPSSDTSGAPSTNTSGAPSSDTSGAAGGNTGSAGAGNTGSDGAGNTSSAGAGPTGTPSVADTGTAIGNTGASTGSTAAATGSTAATAGNTASVAGNTGDSSGNTGNATGNTGSASGNTGSTGASTGTATGNTGASVAGDTGAPSTNTSGAASGNTGGSGELETGDPEGGDTEPDGTHFHPMIMGSMLGVGTIVYYDDNNNRLMTDIPVTTTFSGSSLGRGNHTHGIGDHTHTLASHTHSLASHTHTLGDHTHTLGSHSHNLGNHIHTVDSHAHTLNSHSHSLGNHSHTVDSHSHTVDSHSHTVNSHSHDLNNHAHGLNSHTHTLGGHTHSLAAHTHSISAHTHTLSNHTHTLAAHTHTLNAHTHTLGGHTHTLGNHTHDMGAHTHGLNSHVHSLGSHTHSLNGHTHSLNNHQHTMTPTITMTYGVFRESLANTYDISHLEYRTNSGSFASLASAAIDVGSGWYRLDITSRVQDVTTFRPLQENNTVQIRRKSDAPEGRTVTVDLLLSVRSTIQAINYL